MEQENVLINAQPLKKSFEIYTHLESESSSSLSGFVRLSEQSTFGIIIWTRDGCGEVLSQDNFSDPLVHFVFNSSTSIKCKDETDPIGIGSLVQITWSRAINNSADRKHLIIPINTMHVFKCCPLIEREIYVVYNSQTTPGIAIAQTETNDEVVLHSSCHPSMRAATFHATLNEMSTFETPSMYLPMVRVKRMIKAWLVIVPFSIEVCGSIEKIRGFVIQTVDYMSEVEEMAVVTNIVRNMFMEAVFLATGENVFFTMKSCQSNTVSKISIGSIVSIRATKTFNSSLYYWYGYDVALEKLSSNKVPTIHENILKDVKKETNCDLNLADLSLTRKPKQVESMEKCVNAKNETNDCLKLNTAGIKLKTRFLLSRGLSEQEWKRKHDEICGMYKSARRTSALSRQELMSRRFYDSQMRAKIERTLAEFGLNRYKISETVQDKNVWETMPKENEEEKEATKRLDTFTMEEILQNLADENGIAKGSKLKPTRTIPDSDWNPTERRIIGIHDDFQWIMLGTFAKTEEEVKSYLDGTLKQKPLCGGWWYRRKQCRTEPVRIIKELETRRNILKDCTVDYCNIIQ